MIFKFKQKWYVRQLSTTINNNNNNNPQMINLEKRLILAHSFRGSSLPGEPVAEILAGHMTKQNFL